MALELRIGRAAGFDCERAARVEAGGSRPERGFVHGQASCIGVERTTNPERE